MNTAHARSMPRVVRAAVWTLRWRLVAVLGRYFIENFMILVYDQRVGRDAPRPASPRPMTVSLFLRLLLLLSALPGSYCAHLVGTHNYNHSLASTPTRGDEVLLPVAGIARKLWLCSLGLLRSKILDKVNINFNFGHLCL